MLIRDNLLKEHRLIEFNHKKKKTLRRNIEEVKHDMWTVHANISSLVEADDAQTVLSLARNNGRALEKLTSTYYGLLYIQKEVGLITLNDWEFLRKNIKDYEGMYEYSECLLDNDYVNRLMKRIDEGEFAPPRGSEEYCRCQGYYDLSRVEMGRLIKEFLLNRFPESKFSVKTEWSNWWHKDRVDVKIPPNDGLTIEGVEELLEEYKPRVILSVHY